MSRNATSTQRKSNCEKDLAATSSDDVCLQHVTVTILQSRNGKTVCTSSVSPSALALQRMAPKTCDDTSSMDQTSSVSDLFLPSQSLFDPTSCNLIINKQHPCHCQRPQSPVHRLWSLDCRFHTPKVGIEHVAMISFIPF
jgi:hypothetical protein